jgi:diguanylate cyclase (GGDEF)-like protein
LKLPTLNYQILRLVTGLLCLTSLIIIFFVWLSTTKHAEAQIERDLDVAEEVFKNIFESREDQLYSSALVLTDDFGFKQAIASQDKYTIGSVLKNHSERIAADLMTAIDLDGNIISSTSDAFKNNQPFPNQELIRRTLSEGGVVSLLQFNGTLYQTILVTIDAPKAIAIAQLGFVIDKELIINFKKLTKLDIIVKSSKNNGPPIIISSLNNLDTQTVLLNNAGNSPTSINLSTMIKNDRFMSRYFELISSDNLTVSIKLAENVDKLLAEFNALQYKIISITALSVAASLLLIAIFSKNLTLPLSILAARTNRIADGDYDDELNVSANSKEIDGLISSFKSMQSKIFAREEKILYQSSHDHLTKLFNRVGIHEVIKNKYLSLTRFSIVGIDIKNYRNINDTFGYTNGDNYIKALASRIEKIKGISARISNRELLLLVDDHISEEAVLDIKSVMDATVFIDGIEIRPLLSFCLLRCIDASSIENLFRQVSMTLDKAKVESTPFILYTPLIEKEYITRLNILTFLDNALHHDTDEFTMVYQPKLHTKSGKIFKAEALLRWNNSTIGFVSPEVFIPIAEQSGLIQLITYLVIKKVIMQVKSWEEQSLYPQVAINLSVHDIENNELLPFIIKQLKSHNLSSKQITFEITESDLMSDPKKAALQLCEFREAGFDLSIDDFGTGYSSLSYLKNMPVNELKIDKSFISNLNENDDDKNIVQTIISLAKMFDLQVVAEGVENIETLNLLKAWDCDWIQGYYISKPLSSDDFVERLKHENSSHT